MGPCILLSRVHPVRVFRRVKAQCRLVFMAGRDTSLGDSLRVRIHRTRRPHPARSADTSVDHIRGRLYPGDIVLLSGQEVSMVRRDEQVSYNAPHLSFPAGIG